MIKGIESVKSICELGLSNYSSIRSLSFTDSGNVSSTGQIAPSAEIYHVAFQRYNGSLSEDHQSNQGGDYYIKKASVFVQRNRYVCNRIVAELMDRKVTVLIIDNNGDEHVIHGARFQSRYNTGSGSRDKAGYEWTFSGVDRKKAFFSTKSITEFTGDAYVPPPGDDTELEPAPDPSEPIVTNCCVSILVTPIPEAPLPDGNILNLNKFVTVAETGEKYFIDRHGVSIRLSGGGIQKERIMGTGTHIYTLSREYDVDKVIINRTQNFLIRELSPPPTEIHTFNIDGDQLILPEDWPLEVGNFIEIYEIAA